MLARLVFIVFMVSVAAPEVRARCAYPQRPPDPPDGATATYEQMVTAQTEVRRFDMDISNYNSCRARELQSLLESSQTSTVRKAELEKMHAMMHNAAVDDAQTVAGRFNEQLRKYKSVTDGSSIAASQSPHPTESSNDSSWRADREYSNNEALPQSERSGLSIEEAKNQCLALGFKQGNEEFGKCVLQLSQ